MRVWLAPSRYAPHVGGIETVVAQLAGELAARGDQVLVVTHRHPAGLPVDETAGGIRVRRLTFDAPGRSVGALQRFVASYRAVAVALDCEATPDVLHLHGAANQSLHLARYSTGRGIPLVLTTHGEISGDVEDIFRRSGYFRFSFRFATRVAAAVTAPSEQTLQEASLLAPGVRAKGRVVPNGIRTEAWQRCPPVRATGRVLAWGRLEPQKGFDRLLAAWPLVRRQLPHAELRIAGEGAQRPALEKTASAGVQLLGRLGEAELVQELGSAQIAAVPSRVEAFGMSALEALAGGRPVLHSGVPALSDVVGDHGWVAPHDDPAALAGALVAALREEPRAVPPEAVQRFDWADVVEAYRGMYVAAVSGEASRRETR